MSSNTKTWLHCNVSKPESHCRLICFPHAGGTASFFRSWGSQLKDYEVYSVRYPGRAERIDEPLPTDLCHLAIEIAQAIEPLTDLPLVLFGHSMGAAVALETARILEAQGVNILRIFASGSRQGPCPLLSEQSEEDDDTVCAQLVSLGGMDAKIAADPLFRELVLPAVRADVKMFHAYKMPLEPKLRCSVTTIFGDVDADADIRPWGELTLNEFKEECISGDHFYLIANPPFTILHQYINIPAYAGIAASFNLEQFGNA